MLPEKWKIRVTPENKEVLGRWRTCGSITSSGENEFILSCYNDARGYYIFAKDTRGNDFEEITFEEFEAYVLGTKTIIFNPEIY